ncbi:MAG: peptidoglycan editing factor PgeF [Anaerolineales bacterium]
MNHYVHNGLHYYTFERLEGYGVCHAIFTRKGGISPYPWASLNLGGTVGDAPERVVENRKRAFAALDLKIEMAHDVWQVHSAEVICVDQPRPPQQPHTKADAILTDRKGVHLFMRFADCVPILLYDKMKSVIGIVHAGWQGTVGGIAKKAIEVMNARYGTNPGDVWAGIGPSIGVHHYPVGEDVWLRARDRIPEIAQACFKRDGVNFRFDLWLANQLLLEQAGVGEIEVSGLCTACNLEDWYSHRAEKGKTGRFGVVISL